jgi:hypothetical protein
MEKYYPPFHISSIQEFDDKTLVKVQFYEIDRVKFNDNLTLKDRGGEKLERMNAASGGTLKSIEIFTLPKMNAEEAMAEVYRQIEQANRSKKVIV